MIFSLLNGVKAGVILPTWTSTTSQPLNPRGNTLEKSQIWTLCNCILSRIYCKPQFCTGSRKWHGNCKLIIKIMGIKIFAVIYNSQPTCLFETNFKHVLKVICRLFCHFCVICLHFLPIFSRLIVADVPKLHSVRPQHKKMYVRNRKFCEISTWMRHPRFFSMLFLFSLVPHANNTVSISVKDLYTSERTVMETPVTQKSHFCEYVRNGGVFLTYRADWQLDLE